MSKFRRFAASTLALLGLLAVLGYGLAFAAESECVSDTRNAVNEKQIKHVNIDGTVFTNADVAYESKVLAPFLVSITFELPLSIHTSSHENWYVTFPWKLVKIPRKTIYNF